MLNPAFFSRDVVTVARELIGVSLSVGGTGGLVVETEAYSIDDAAAHSYAGKTARNASMFGPSGCAYVYRSYGLHWCLNFVCLEGCGVLIRALEPQFGIDQMRERRGLTSLHLLCSGPGRLTQALAVNAQHNGRNLFAAPFELQRVQTPDVDCGPRIGISKAVENPWRFGKRGSPFLSRKFKTVDQPTA